MSSMDAKVRIQGSLTPLSVEGVKPNTPSKIADALRVSSLRIFINEDKWSQGIITFNSVTLPLGGRRVGLGIVSMLSDFIRAEGVKELSLAGKLTIITETNNEPAMIRVTVEDGKLRYQQSVLQWEPELVG